MHLTLAVLATLVAAIYAVKKCNTDIDKYRADALNAHNYYRALHGVGPLTLDASVTKTAQAYADYLASTGQFGHSQTNLGENLAMANEWPVPAAGWSGAEPVREWYNEISNYRFNSPGYSGKTGHFTQLVWKASTKLGLGVGFSTDCQTVVTVGNYSPGGNMDTPAMFKANVLPPRAAGK